MTLISIDRFLRFELILHAIADTVAAEMATNLAGIFIEANGGELNGVPWRSLADRYGQSGEALQDILTEADSAAGEGFGFSLLARGRRTFFLESDEFIAGDDHTQTEGIALSKEFLAILTGASAPRLWVENNTPQAKPNPATAASIALLHDAAQAGGAPFLYRQAESEDSLCYLEMTEFATALAMEGGIPIHVATNPPANPSEPDWIATPPLASLLSAVLHLPDLEIILFPFTDQLATEEQRPDDEEETPYVPGRKASRPRMVLTQQARTFLRLCRILRRPSSLRFPRRARFRSMPRQLLLALSGRRASTEPIV